MDKPKDLLFLDGISCLSFNKDCSSKDIIIIQNQCVYSLKKTKTFTYINLEKISPSNHGNQYIHYQMYICLNIYSQHLQYVYSVDWHPTTNKIISGAHDRNIYIWTYNANKNSWEPGLVNFKTKISVSQVKWSNDGDKFLACSSKLLATGYYEKDCDWWTCKSIKEHKSYVSCAKFDKSGLFILSGSTDKKAFISSSYIKSVDDGKQIQNLKLPFAPVNTQFLILNYINYLRQTTEKF